MTDRSEHRAATIEARPVLWCLVDVTGRRDVERLVVSEHSTVANLIPLDVTGRLLRGLRDRLGVDVEYRDTVVQIARRLKAACLARQ